MPRHPGWRGVAAIATAVAAASTAALTSGAQAGVAPPEGWGGALPGFTAVRVGAAGGTIAAGWISSGSGRVPVAVYLPPGFSFAKSYPVVYLIRASGSASGLDESLGLPDDTDKPIAAFLGVTAIAPPRSNESKVVDSLVPWVEAHLPAIPARSGRTIVGIGTAATTAVEIGLRSPETFGTVEAWGGRFDEEGASLVARTRAERLRKAGTRVYLSLAASDAPVAVRGTGAFAQVLSGLRVPHELWIDPGRSGVDLWRSQLTRALGFALADPVNDAPVIERASLVATRSTCGTGSKSPLAYGYPLEPFQGQHPIRGNFGDPRTVSSGDLGETTRTTKGSFTFHNGVDISATTGQAVYPVVSGVAKVMSSDWVSVWTHDARVFQYFHIKPSVRTNQAVTVDRTVLGHVLPGVNHVHLTEIDGFTLHNPTDPGHLEPYADHTAPFVDSLSFSTANGKALDPRQLRGRILIAASAADTPSMPVPGNWLGLPVTPALVSWRLSSPTGKALGPEHVVVDFRRTEPPNRDFWNIYAAGTYQNFPTFGNRYYFGQAGQYRFDLTPAALDTRTLRNGRYTLTVEAADVCGNRGSLSETLSVANPPGL
jgi:murein DD-endopeptidase MepM/ murein hydrolase activator NlpD